ncbi:MAG: SDR family oxidoreductase [Calditrichaeota bacterium]|nr:MAG: SDR family oxidoreductase [Calditrichota bacterium]
MKLKNKMYLVVGGTRGIGAEIVRRLHDGGADVITASRNKTDHTVEHVNHIQVDVTSDDISSFAEKLPDRLDGVAYCPGTITLRPFQSMKLNDFTNDLNINLLGAVRVIQQVIPHLKRNGGGSVVLFSTVATRIGMKFHASIAAAKAAVEGLAISLAAEYSSANIRFNVIAPSLTNTSLAQHLLSNETKQKAASERHPLNRFGDPSDIASLSVFLLSDDSGWITGQIIPVDGGLSSVKPL